MDAVTKAVALNRRQKAREKATEFVSLVNSETYCSICGKQPIEWHGEHHPAKPNSRISSLRTQGASIERIKLEMTVCTPLCRSCHMTEDGRLVELHKRSPQKAGQTYVFPLPCIECGKLTKPRRRERCNACYNRLMGIRQPNS